jgi:hypothetical protein
MKKPLKELFEDMEAAEAASLLEGIETEKLGRRAARRLAQRANEKAGVEKSAPARGLSRRAVSLIAAAAVLLVGMTIGGAVYAAEAKEYKAANEFLLNVGFSTEGLTRGEVMAVYRDIATGSFTYDKTAELLAAVDNSAIPADVLEYAGGEGMASIKEFMKTPGFGYIDEENQEDGGKMDSSKFASAEEIDALTLGQGYRLSHEKIVFEERGDTLADSTVLSDRWIFALNGKSGPAVYFTVSKDASGRFSYAGAMQAYNLSNALSIMKKLAIKAEVSFEPIVAYANFEYLVAQNFNGDERMIVVPGGDAFKLEGDYFLVTWYGQLPAYKEYAAKALENYYPYINPETGEPDLSRIPSGGADPAPLHPDLSVKAPNRSAGTGSLLAAASPIVVLIPVAVSALIAVVVFVILNRKGEKKSNAEENAELLTELGGIGAEKESSRRVFKKVRELDGGAPAQKRVKFRLSMRLLYAAAAVVLLAALGTGAYAYAAEAKEYKAAKEFFMDNGLSTEGLTRGEIKAVYRDITTESFTYDKTAEVIAHNLETNHIAGWELISNDPDPDPVDVKQIWEQLWVKYQGEIHYFCDWQDVQTVENGVVHVSMKEGSITKCIGNEPIWTYTTDNMRFYHEVMLTEDVLGVGAVTSDYEYPEDGDFDDSERRYMPAISRLTEDGKLVWFAKWDNGWPEEQISSVVENEDGSLTVISSLCDREKKEFALCVTRLSEGGENLGSVIEPMDNEVWACDAAAFDGGYLAVIYETINNNEKINLKQSVVRIEKDGTVAGIYSYSSEGKDYTILSIAPFGGKLYISAQLNDRIDYGALWMRNSNGEDISDEEYTELAKQSTTAFLLVTDEPGGEVRVFYEIKGAVPHDPLKVEDGKLVYSVGVVVKAHYTPIINTRTKEWTLGLIEYVFDAEGALVETREVGSSVYLD